MNSTTCVSLVFEIAYSRQMKLEQDAEPGSDSVKTPFQKLFDLCNTSNEFADELLDHQNIDFATFAEYLNMTGYAVSIEKKTNFRERCVNVLLSDLLTVSEEAFALLILENGFNSWKWSVQNQFCAGTRDSSQLSRLATQSPRSDVEDFDSSFSSTNAFSSSSITSTTANRLGGTQGSTDDDDDDDNEDDVIHSIDDVSTQVGPGLRYQSSQRRSDGRPGAGPWTVEGMIRYNAIVEKVVQARKVRGRFENLLRNHYRELDVEAMDTKRRKRRKKKSDCTDEDGSPRKVVVIDLLSTCNDSD